MATATVAEIGLPRVTALAVTLGITGGRRPIGGASFTVRAGEVVGIVGGRRSGKSALLRAVAGLAVPVSGLVSVCGLPILDQRSSAQYSGATAPVRLLSGRDFLAALDEQDDALDAPVLVLDEPTARLTGHDRQRVWHGIVAARLRQQAVLVALDPDDLWDNDCDRAYLVDGGLTRHRVPTSLEAAYGEAYGRGA